MSQKCEVENCIGIYVTKTIYYVNLRKRNTPEYEVSIEDYEKLENKKGHCSVISETCNVCGDDLDEHLVSFIRENSHSFVDKN